VTNRKDWTNFQILHAYNKLPCREALFRISKGRKGPWWPMHHWTDSKIRVHALYCHFALLMLRIIEKELRSNNNSMSVDRAIERLKQIHETRVIYTNGAAERILSELDSTQQELAQILGIYSLAEQMGTTVLKP
jgi:transposase